ncbi:MAG: metal ABC transporter substrate-binding protein [Clostridia bacterium]|nr:metal ABC transporter substrate-binding protein [Clostridia bacterium]
MKRKHGLSFVLSLLLTACLVWIPCFSLAGGDGASGLNIVATAFPAYDFVRQITGGNANITMLLPPGGESHFFDPTPRDILTIQDADVFISIGGENEAWVERVLSSVDTENMLILTLMDAVELIEEEIVEGMQVDDHGHDHDEDHDDDHGHDHDEDHDDDCDDEDHDHDDHDYDEHVWTSPKNAKRIMEYLSNALAELDPANADAYGRNTAAYVEQLDALDAAFRVVVDNAVRNTIVFGDRFPFRYFAAEYGLDYYAAFPGCSTSTDPTPRTLVFLMDKVNDEEIPVVFHIELSNERVADLISEGTGAQKLLLHSVHNVTRADFDAGLTYVDLMTRNVDALKEALW